MGKPKPQEPEDNEEQLEYPSDDYDHEAHQYLTKEDIKNELLQKIAAVDGSKKVAFAALFALHESQQDLEEQRDKEIEEIKHKYRLQSEGIINRAKLIVQGESAENALLSKAEMLTEEEKQRGLKGIQLPEYWPTVLKNSSFSLLIDRAELPAVDSVTDIVVDYSPSTNQLKIELHFSENPVFTDKVLTATLTESEDKISHKYEQPHFKPHYVRPERGLFSVFGEAPQEELDGLFEYWLNFYQVELPQAL